MKNHLPFLLKAALCLFLIISLTGCWNRRELDMLAIVMGMGLDKDHSQIRLTAQIAKPTEIKMAKSGGGGDDGKAFLNLKSAGKTFSTALSGFTSSSTHRLYFPHNQFVIFGREIAEEGVQKYTDFFIRQPENRLTVWVLVAPNKAEEILDTPPPYGKIPALDISSLIRTQIAISPLSAVTMKQFLTGLSIPTMAPVAPLIEVSGAGGEQKTILSGLAVFKKGKLIGQLDQTETRGLSWVISPVNDGLIEVGYPGGADTVCLQTIRSSHKMTPELQDNRIRVRIKIKEEGNVYSQSCQENLALPPVIAVLEKVKAAAIRSQIMAALKKARGLNTDIFGFGEAVHQKYPKQWKRMESQWDQLFPGIEVKVTVEAKLRRVGSIGKPANAKKE